jgi:hypothetical protein
MSVTLEQVARDVLASVNSQRNYLIAAQWTRNRIQELANASKLRAYRRTGELTLPAAYDTGTVDVTNGSKVVTGTSTAWTADLLRHRFLRVKRNWYAVASIDSTTQLRLKSEYAEDTGTTQSYELVKRYHELPRDTRAVGWFTYSTRFRALDPPMSLHELDAHEPERILVSDSGPWVWAEVGLDAESDKRIVEFYPPPETSRLLHYVYWVKPADDMQHSDLVPEAFDLGLLKEGVLIDVMRVEASDAARNGNVELAAYWRNEYRAQETRWERKKQMLKAADRGADDTQFLLRTLSTRAGVTLDRDISTAYAEVWSR